MINPCLTDEIRLETRLLKSLKKRLGLLWITSLDYPTIPRQEKSTHS